MSLQATLGRYLARAYLWNFLGFLMALLAIVYLFDTVELLRRASKQDIIPLSLVLQMSLLKLPEVGQILLPFAVLFSAMFTFWQLSKRQELVIIRAAGISVWQFLMPILLVGISIGFLHMMIINPLSSLFLNKFEQLESEYLKAGRSDIALFKEGLWLRQDTEQGYAILHAGKISQPEWVFDEMAVYFFDRENRFYQRIDARDTVLMQGEWIFGAPVLFDEDNNGAALESFRLPTELSVQDIEESFASPETMSFWQLPAQIRIFEETGFDNARLKMQYQSLLAKPLLFPAMILLAASVSMRPSRSRGAVKLIGAGILMGFTLFFLTSFLQALGSTSQIPVSLAAWSPSLIALFFSLSLIINFEDG